MATSAPNIPEAPTRKKASAQKVDSDSRFGPLKAFASPFAEYKIGMQNWQRMSMLSWAVTSIAIIGYILKSSQPTMIPYVVSVDRTTGAYVNVGVPPREDAAGDIVAPIVQYTIKQFISGVRTVTPDQQMQNYLVSNYVKPFVSDNGQAAQMMNDFYKTNNPFDLGSKEIVVVDVDIPTAISASSYQISWKETAETLAGVVTGTTYYTGTVTTEFHTVPQDQQKYNPLGIYIKEIHWTVKTANTEGTTK
jgi:type IV secretory pathway TrbF-like protein